MKGRNIRIGLIAMAMSAVGVVQAADYSFSFGSLVLPNTTTNGAGVLQNFSPVSTSSLRGFYLSGNWTGTASSASVVRVGLNNNAGWTTALTPQSGDRTTGGSTTTAAASPIGAYTSIYNNAAAPTNSNGDTTINGPIANGSWTMNVRQATATAGTYNVSNAVLHLLTDAIAPMSGQLNANSPIYQRASTVTGFGTGTLNAGTAFRYGVHTFIAPTTGTYMVGSVTRQPGATTQLDGWISLYQGVFNAASPLTNIVGVDDDGGHGVGPSSAMFINLTGGQLYSVVQSTFTNNATMNPPSGDYTIYVAGAVPEPATMAILGLGIVPFLRKRRN